MNTCAGCSCGEGNMGENNAEDGRYAKPVARDAGGAYFKKPLREAGFPCMRTLNLSAMEAVGWFLHVHLGCGPRRLPLRLLPEISPFVSGYRYKCAAMLYGTFPSCLHLSTTNDALEKHAVVYLLSLCARMTIIALGNVNSGFFQEWWELVRCSESYTAGAHGACSR